MSEVLASADANMRAAWRVATGSGPAASAVERDGLLLLTSGLPVPIFNPAFVSAPPEDASALVEEIVQHYRAAGVPFVVYFRDEHAGDLAAACAGAGLVEHYRPPLMVLDPIVGSPPVADGVDVRQVDASSLDDCCRVLGEGFGMPIELARQALSPAVLDADDFSAYLVLVDGEPAATAAAFVTGEVSGVYNVATVPAHRGRGLGSTATWAAVDAGVRARARRAILQASAEGAPVYERMGFTTPDRYRQFEPGS